MGQTIVIINNIKLAVEMLEKRSVKYSSRPRQVFAGEMCVLLCSPLIRWITDTDDDPRHIRDSEARVLTHLQGGLGERRWTVSIQ